MYDLAYMDYFRNSPILTKIDLLHLHIYLGQREGRYVEDLKALLNGKYMP